MKKKKVGIYAYPVHVSHLQHLLEREDIQSEGIREDFFEIFHANTLSRFRKIALWLKKTRAYDAIYFGHGILPYPLCLIFFLLSKMQGRKIFLHWIGTDVMKLERFSKIKKKILNTLTCNLACAPWLVEELKDEGIEADFLPIISSNLVPENMSIPEKHAILTYIPTHREEYFSYSTIELIANTFPDVPVYITGNDGSLIGEHPANMHFLGFISKAKMKEYYSKSSVFIRLPKHDGLGLTALESLGYGRATVYSYNLPHCIYFHPDKHEESSLLAMLKVHFALPPEFHEEAHNYILESFSMDKIIARYDQIVWGRSR
jgi:hypothetical protein